MELFHNPSVAAYFLPVVAFAIVAEGLYYAHLHGRYPWGDSFTSIGLAAGHLVSGIVTNALITTGLAVVVWQLRIHTVDMSKWYNIVILFVLVEFAYYWYHRAAHRVRILWGSHSVHHTPEELTLSASYRLSWTPILSGSWLFFLPLVFIGYDPVWVFGFVSGSLAYQFWLHTTVIPRLGPLEWILNTPSAHRVHHASNAEYLDRNYGGVLIIFDRLFGTYVAEDPDIKIKYGLTHPVNTHNPIRIAYQELWAMVKDIAHAKHWRDRLGYVLAPPGWAPDKK